MFSFFLVLFGLSVLLLGKLIAPFFATIILGIVTTGMFSPVFRLFSHRCTPRLSSVFTCFVIFFVIFIPVVFFVGILSKETFGLYTMGRDAVLSNQLIPLLESTQFLSKLNELLSRAGIHEQVSWNQLFAPISEVGKMVGFSLFQQVRLITSNVLGLVFYFCLMLIINFYMFVDGEKFVQYLYDLSPLPDEHDKELFEKFNGMAGAVLIGNGLGGVIQGIIGGVLFWFLDINSPFLWGVIMGFLAFLPIVGIGVVLIPLSVVFLLKGSVGVGVFIFAFYAVLSWGIEYIFKPKVVGDRVAMHPLIVFFAIIGGLKAYGLLGIIYGPLIATLFLTLVDIYFASFRPIVDPTKRDTVT